MVKRKIAFVSQPIDGVLPPNQNSLGVWIHGVARRLARHHEVRVYCPGKNRLRTERLIDHGVEYVKIPDGFDLVLHRALRKLTRFPAPRRPRFASLAFYPVFALRVAYALSRDPAEIVHIFNFSQYVPLIRLLNPDARIILRMSCEWLNQLDPSMIERRLEDLDLIVGCSDYITEKIRGTFPGFSDRCVTIHNGRDVSHFVPAPGRTGRRILFVGRVSPEKGLHVLADALALLDVRFPDLEVTVIGPQKPAPSEYIVSVSDNRAVVALQPLFSGDYLEQVRQRLPERLRERITFINQLPHADLLRHYHEADIFVFPSVWDEPAGNPPIEAMASGLPVVSTTTGGTGEYVEDGKTGILVEPGNAPALAAALGRLLDDEKLQRRMGEAGRRRAVEKFSFDRLVDDLIVRYEQLELETA